DWAIFVRLARALAQRAGERNTPAYKDKDGKERRVDRVVEAVTCGGIYEEDDDEGVARDAFVNCGNVEPIGWEAFKRNRIPAFITFRCRVCRPGRASDT